MPRIEIVEPQFNVPTVQLPSPGTGGAAMLGEAADYTSRINAYLEQREQENANVETTRELSGIRARYLQQAVDDEANGNIDETYVARRRQQLANDTADILQREDLSNYARKLYGAGLADFRNEMLVKWTGQQANVRGQTIHQQKVDSMTDLAKSAFNDPASFGKLDAIAAAASDNYKATPERIKNLKEYRKIIGVNALQGMSRQPGGPDKVLAILGNGGVDPQTGIDYGIDGADLPAHVQQMENFKRFQENQAEQAVGKEQTLNLNKHQTRVIEAQLKGTPIPVVTETDAAALGPNNTETAKQMTMQAEIQRQGSMKAWNEVIGRKQAGLPLDPTNATHKAGVDYDYAQNYAKDMQQYANPTLEKARLAANIYELIPPAIEFEFRRKLFSGDQGEIADAVNFMSYMETMPRGQSLLQAAFPANARERYSSIKSEMDDGVPMKEAIEHVQTEEKTPKAVKDGRAESFKDIVATDPSGYVAGMVLEATKGQAGFFTSPAMVTPDAIAHMNRLRKEEYVRYGRRGSADAYAKRMFANTWGLSRMDGFVATTQAGPEHNYGNANLSMAENWKWIEGQARDMLTQHKVPIGPEDQIILKPDDTRVKPGDGKPVYKIGVIFAKDSKMFPAGQLVFPLDYLPQARKEENRLLFIPNYELSDEYMKDLVKQDKVDRDVREKIEAEPARRRYEEEKQKENPARYNKRGMQ